jgi:hypothetical protein
VAQGHSDAVTPSSSSRSAVEQGVPSLAGHSSVAAAAAAAIAAATAAADQHYNGSPLRSEVGRLPSDQHWQQQAAGSFQHHQAAGNGFAAQGGFSNSSSSSSSSSYGGEDGMLQQQRWQLQQQQQQQQYDDDGSPSTSGGSRYDSDYGSSSSGGGSWQPPRYRRGGIRLRSKRALQAAERSQTTGESLVLEELHQVLDGGSSSRASAASSSSSGGRSANQLEALIERMLCPQTDQRSQQQRSAAAVDGRDAIDPAVLANLHSLRSEEVWRHQNKLARKGQLLAALLLLEEAGAVGRADVLANTSQKTFMRAAGECVRGVGSDEGRWQAMAERAAGSPGACCIQCPNQHAPLLMSRRLDARVRAQASTRTPLPC